MSGMELPHADHAAELRRAFDHSFAAPAELIIKETIDFVAVRLGADVHALRMSEIAGVFDAIKVTPCPGPLPEMVGLAGFRSVLTPVYDLAALLGYPTGANRWVMLAHGRALAFAFDAFEGHFRVEPAALASHQGTAGSQYIHQIARRGTGAWPIIDLLSVVATIRTRAAASADKEH